MKGYNLARLTVALLLLMFCGVVLQMNRTVHAQTSTQFPDLDKNGKPLIPRPNPFLMYSPADLNHNAVTLPATSDDIAKPQPLNPSPGTGYALYGQYDLLTAQTLATGAQQIYIGTELAPTSTSGTLALAVRLPQAAVSFQESQTGATPGTCTGRLAVKYN